MGDGSVACAPSQLIMEKFSICKTNGNTKLNSPSKSSISLAKVNPQMKPKNNKGSLKNIKIVDKEVAEKNSTVDDVCNNNDKDEVEEGELGTLPFENGEFFVDKPARRYDVKSEIEKGEFVPGKWRKSEWDKWPSKDELEKGEFIPDRWYSKSRRYDAIKDKSWKNEHEWTSPSAKERSWKFDRESERTPPYVREKVWKFDRDWSPPSGKDKSWRGDRERTPSSSGKCFDEKELDRSGGSSQHLRKLSSRYEADKTQKGEFSYSRNHAREYSFSKRLKRQNNDSEISDWKYRVDQDEYYNSKTRKLSDDGSRSTFSSENYVGRAAERPHKNARDLPSDRYSSRHLESSGEVHDWENSSPRHEQSSHERSRDYDYWDRSPPHHDRSPYERVHQYERSRSPYERTRHYDNKYRHRSSYGERSPRDHSRDSDEKSQIPSYSERSPRDSGRRHDYKETNRRAGTTDKRSSHYGSKGQEGKVNLKESGVKELQIPAKESPARVNPDTGIGSSVETIRHKCEHKVPSQTPDPPNLENGVTEDPESMEEDMDICNTPPHVPVVSGVVSGKWYYLDRFGTEQGPSKLSDLKTLVDEGFLMSDHMIKHLDSDRWVTVENAVSPLVSVNFPSVVPDAVTQHVSPPEAPGNLLADGSGTSGDLVADEILGGSSHQESCLKENVIAATPVENWHIDDRVGALLEGVTLIPGKEFDMLAEVLQLTSQHEEGETGGKIQGFAWHQPLTDEHCEDGGVMPSDFGFGSEGTVELRSMIQASCEDNTLTSTDTDIMYSGHWACKGGDWKRDDEGSSIMKWRLVLNDGYPLCQMPKSGCEDPRWQQKDDLYPPSHTQQLDLPPWAFTSPDDLLDSGGLSRSSQSKSSFLRGGVKGQTLPVVRINACVVMDHGSLVSEPRVKGRGKEKYSSRLSRSYPIASDPKRLVEDGLQKIALDTHSQDSKDNNVVFSMPKDPVCKVYDLKLHMGDWYYLDGSGHERGPFSFAQLQVMADQGIIQKQSSVFRKHDKIWVPIHSASDSTRITSRNDALRGFHDLHPQFVSYTRGKLHEFVMKSYKSREFAAAINEVLNPWINVRQPKKEIEKQMYHSDHFGACKRARIDEMEEEDESQEDMKVIQQNECTFDELCGGYAFEREEHMGSEVQRGDWGFLSGHILARIFHCLRSDIKSLGYAAMTCRHWRSVAGLYKNISTQVDFCAISATCSDAMALKIMNDYKKENITSLLLRGCKGITAGTLEGILQSFPYLSSIDIRGCTQFEDLICKFPNIYWVRTRGFQVRTRNINLLTSANSSTSNHIDDSTGLKEYLESSDKRDSANQLFRRSLYKRSKLFDARKSSAILSRDAQIRRLAIKKTINGYKRMQEFVAMGLRDIMKQNTVEFFESKVSEIEERMKNGYYARRGLKSIKDDISRMCRDAIKVKNRSDSRDVNRIISLFIRLATSLDEGSNLAFGRDEVMKSWKDDSPPGFSSASSKYKKNPTKVSERKHSYRSNGSPFMSGPFDTGDYASDREIRRRLSKLQKKSLDSESDASDEFDKSSNGSASDSASTASDTESDLDSPLRGAVGESRGATYFIPEDGLESLADDREWGARMTKAGLVPPVTRKYEVIDHYVIVADEKEVRRKMQVSLPEDYAEKLNAQRNGTEESDMEIPEVKEYKPRKSLGDEVIEQEVYGIDPYTHNLLLDSMPEESDWSLLDKHLFIEEVLLRALNKQVRKFTGSGNTPMMYPLKPVFEEILETAEENNDRATIRFCEFILKAIDSRPVDNYVAYRKGLGVVCNKESGFSEEDFVVEFLGEVYPTWKWFEKQDGIRALQKNNKDPAPEFYNIYLERPKGDADGYDLVVVDAMHKANYASRICHSCRPNCEAKVTAVDGQYQIGIYSVRPIAYGEEITFDYNSVTESKEEYEASVCLCGHQVCRGSYLNLTGEGAFQKVLKDYHGLLDRHQLMVEACEVNLVSEEDYIDLGRAGLGSCLLGGLPNWLIAYSARLVRFINLERTKLPDEILRHNIEEKKKYFAEIHLDVEKSDAEIQAEGVYNQRLQNLALTIDKVRYVMRCVFGDPKEAPPPLERLSPEEVVSYLWNGEGSFIEELIHCMAPHMEDATLRELKAKIHAHDPSGSLDVEMELRKSLLWLRDEVRNLPCTYKCRNDAAADLIHVYAHTNTFFKIREYKRVTSPPVYITPLDLGPKYADKLGSGVHEYCKTYGEIYCLGQLMYWYNQNAEPDASLVKASRGCLSLPDIGSFYAKVQKPSRQRVYGHRTVKFMLTQMEKHPQRPWPKDRIWSFKSSLKFIGSPMLDAVLSNSPINREMVQWLKHRPSVYQAMWDR